MACVMSEAEAAWLFGHDTGVSSKTIFSVMTGVPCVSGAGGAHYPLDPSDFGRCYRLLKRFPAWRERLMDVAAAYPEWKPMVERWDEMTALYEEEIQNANGRAPKLYRLMRQLRGLEPMQATDSKERP